MGLAAFWWLLVVGALVGQVTLVANIGIWFGLTSWPQLWLAHLVEQAVKAGVRDLLDSEITTTTTTSTPYPWWPSLGVDSAGFFIAWRLSFLGVVLIITLLGVCLLALCVSGCWPTARGQSESRPDSPLSGRVPIEDLARNQLAELRLRRHGTSRAIRAS